jgi:nucleotide-binding universal stress UspA family protein
MKFRHILFPVDFSPPCEQAVPWVLQMSEYLGSRLTLLHVLEMPYPWFADSDPRLLEDLTDHDESASRQQTSMAQFRRAHLPSAVTEIILRKGDPAEQIVEYARSTDVDLIMMPTHGYGRFRAALLGSVTAKVIHDVPCAVWTSAHIEKLHSPPYPARQIVCAVDDTEESVRIIRDAGLLAEELECSWIVIHAVPHGKRQSESQLCSRLQSCEAFEEARVPICVENGEIATVVPEIARRYGADLLITGRGHAADFLASFRSHVYPIVRTSPCPVLTM